jgi:hypothetical protein
VGHKDKLEGRAHTRRASTPDEGNYFSNDREKPGFSTFPSSQHHQKSYSFPFLLRLKHMPFMPLFYGPNYAQLRQQLPTFITFSRNHRKYGVTTSFLLLVTHCKHMNVNASSNPVSCNFVAGLIMDVDTEVLQRMESAFEEADGML